MDGRSGAPRSKVLQLNEAHAEAAIRDDRIEMPVLVPALRHHLTNGSIQEPMIKAIAR